MLLLAVTITLSTLLAGATPAAANTRNGIPIRTDCTYGSASSVDMSTTYSFPSFRRTSWGSALFLKVTRFRWDGNRWVATWQSNVQAGHVDASGYVTQGFHDTETGRNNGSQIVVPRQRGYIKLAIHLVQVDNSTNKVIYDEYSWVEHGKSYDCRYV